MPNHLELGILPNHESKSFASLHLILKGQVIGDPHEECYIGTWGDSLKRIKERIELNFDLISNPEFTHKSDREIFELINKSNQLEEDFTEEFKQLNKLDESVFTYCSISIDETTDAYSIRMSGHEDQLKIFWCGWRDPCPIEHIDKLYSVSIPRESVLEVMDKCLSVIALDQK